MGNLAKQYGARARGEGVGPSGQLYQWHRPTADEYGAVFGNLPPLTYKDDGEVVVSKESVEQQNALNRALALQCVDSPKLLDDTAKDFTEPGEDVEWLPISAVLWTDLNWLGSQILSALAPVKTETARRAL